MKNRTRALVSSLLTLAMIIGFMPGASIKASAAGADNWYKDANISWYNKDWNSFTIDTAEKLAGLAKLVNEKTDDFKGDTVTLAADIDLTGHEWTPIGCIYPFDGTFDGGGHKIEGVNISTDAIRECGLFGYLSTSACIKDINVENVNIASSYYAADAGGIVGYSCGGTVENCLATGTVTVTGAQANAGGAIGYCENAAVGEDTNGCEVKNSFSECYVIGGDTSIVGGFVGISINDIYNCWSTGDVHGGNATADTEKKLGFPSYTGGFIGYNSSNIMNCYSTGDIAGGCEVPGGHKALIGGFMGKNYGAVINCYSAGSVTGGSLATLGGFTGGSNNLITNVYWNKNAPQTVGGVSFNGEKPKAPDVGGLTGSVMKGDAPDVEITYKGSAGDITTGTAEGAFLEALNGGIGAIQLPAGTASQWKPDSGNMSANVNKGFPFLYNTAPTAITVSGASGAKTVQSGKTLKMTAEFAPSNVMDLVKWSISSGSEFASISEKTGVLTANAVGGVTVRAASVNTPAVYGETSITVTSPPPVLTGITVSGAAGAVTVQNGATLQMTAAFVPSGIVDSVKWSISSGSEYASIDENTGFLTAKAAGSATVRAVSVNTPAVYGEIVITVTAIPTPPAGNRGGSEKKPPSAAVDTKNGTTTAVTEVSAGSSSNGVASASVTEEQIGGAVSKAAEDAKGKESDKTELIINVKTSGNITGVSVTMPRAAFNKAAGGGIDALTLSSPAVSVTFDKAALSEIKAKGTGDFSITAKLMSPGNLSQEDREKVGGRPVYNLTVTSGNTAISDLGGGKATVSIPYKLAPGEDPNKIVIYYISGSGSMTMIPGCIYNPSTGMVTFATEHFSVYAVAYNDVGFKDVSGWYGDYVNYLAARGIISGGKDGVFSPDANITRAEFITIMANLSGSAPDGYAAPSFSDVSTADWYFKAVEWAYAAGVTTGSNGRFDPKAYITRQDIAVIIARYAEKKGITLLKANSAATFTDSGKIAPYAIDAVTAAQRAGIISGNSDGSFAPEEYATRAQTAKMIAQLMHGMI